MKTMTNHHRHHHYDLQPLHTDITVSTGCYPVTVIYNEQQPRFTATLRLDSAGPGVGKTRVGEDRGRGSGTHHQVSD